MRIDDRFFFFTWTAILRQDGKLSLGSGPRTELHNTIGKLVQQGSELGDACDRVFGGVNHKQKDGYIGLATGGIVKRLDVTRHSVIAALTPFVAEKYIKD